MAEISRTGPGPVPGMGEQQRWVSAVPKAWGRSAPPSGQVGSHSVQQAPPRPPASPQARADLFIPHLGTDKADGGWMSARAQAFADHPGLRDATKHLDRGGWMKVVGQYQQELGDTFRLMGEDPAFARLDHKALKGLAADVLANVLARHAKSDDAAAAKPQGDGLRTARRDNPVGLQDQAPPAQLQGDGLRTARRDNPVRSQDQASPPKPQGDGLRTARRDNPVGAQDPAPAQPLGGGGASGVRAQSVGGSDSAASPTKPEPEAPVVTRPRAGAMSAGSDVRQGTFRSDDPQLRLWAQQAGLSGAGWKDASSVEVRQHARLTARYGQDVGNLAWTAASAHPGNKTVADRVVHARHVAATLSNALAVTTRNQGQRTGIAFLSLHTKQARAEGRQPLRPDEQRALRAAVDKHIAAQPDFGKRSMAPDQVRALALEAIRDFMAARPAR